MKQIFFLIIACSFLSISCNKKDCSKKISVKNYSTDSTSISIAIIPTLDCIPLYIASQQHIYDSLGISIQVKMYGSQMDAEQSVIKGQTMGCATDLFRVGLMQYQKRPIRFVFTTNREWQLIANKLLRVSKVEQLNDRMVGIARNSATDYLCDFAASRIKSPNQILRPQLNNLFIRQNMLESNQIDAAFLPQPLALLSRKRGNTMLPISKQQQQGLAGFAFSSELLSNKEFQKKLPLILKGYNLVVNKLRDEKKLTLSKEAIKLFHLEEIADSIQPKGYFSKSYLATPEQTTVVLKWLRQRNLIKSIYSGDTIIYNPS